VDQVYLLDSTGKIIASNNSSLLNRPFPYLNASFFAHPHADVDKPFSGHSQNNTTSNGLLLPVHPTPNCLSPYKLPAYIALITSYNDEQMTLRTILFTVGITAALMIGLGALIISFFTGIMFKPLHQVTRATRALARGNLEQRVPPSQSRDEIAELTASFNQMADRIQQMFTAQQAAEKRAQRFVSDASHELRTPITSLRGFTEVLIRGAKDDPETMQHVLGLMKIETERMTDLVNNLLTLARLDEGYVPAPSTIDLVDLVIECQQESRKLARAPYKLSLDLVTQERLNIYANREQLKQMLLALLSNAVKYGCPGSQKNVSLRLDKIESRAQLQIINNGDGIVEEDLPHVFERFYRGRNATDQSTPISGTGLGLPIALAIAQAYEGTITVCSHPGVETTITVTFPAFESGSPLPDIREKA
jgi:two-component system OmpR family sensor kinase